MNRSAVDNQSLAGPPHRSRREAMTQIAAAAMGASLVPSAVDAAEPRIDVRTSDAAFDAADASLPHGGVSPAHSGAENSAALEELFNRVRRSSAARKYIRMPAGSIEVATTVSPSGRLPGRGQRADFLRIEFPNTRIVASGDTAAYMPIQLCDDDGRFFDMDHFGNNRVGVQQVPWSKTLDTPWIQNDENGTLRKMRTIFNCRNCEGLHLSGDLTIDGGGLRDLAALASTGGGGGRTGMFRGMIDNLRIERVAVGVLGGNFGASPDNHGIADHFTDVGIRLLELNQSVQTGFVGHSNHFDNLTVDKIAMACPYNSYLSNTHNITIGAGFMNVPSGTKSRRQLVLMGTNLRIANIYFNSGGGPPWPSDGHILIGERTVLDILYHNDISKATTTGCHLAMGRVPSGVPCTRASLTARVDIRSAFGVKAPAAGVNPGMLWLDTAGGEKCRRQIDLYQGADRADYDILKIDGRETTNDKIRLFDVRDDQHYGGLWRVEDGALKAWG